MILFAGASIAYCETSGRTILTKPLAMPHTLHPATGLPAEWSATKTFGPLNATLNYTLSRNDRQFPEINNEAWFPFIYDRRHDLFLMAAWQIFGKYSQTSDFTFSTGAPCALPVAFSASDDHAYRYYIYENVNNRRLPAYHRMDVAMTRTGKTKKRNRKQLSINIFNIYARQNPTYLYYNANTGKAYQRALFSIIPSVSFSREF